MACREERDDHIDENKKNENENKKNENLTEESSKVTAPVASTDVADEPVSSNSLLPESNTSSRATTNGDTQSTQDVVTTPTAPDIRSRSSSSSELLSPMHDHTYALPSLLITPTMMAAIDSHSLSHKGYTCLSKVGQISVPPQLPAEHNSLKKSVEFLREAHTHLGA